MLVLTGAVTFFLNLSFNFEKSSLKSNDVDSTALLVPGGDDSVAEIVIPAEEEEEGELLPRAASPCCCN